MLKVMLYRAHNGGQYEFRGKNFLLGYWRIQRATGRKLEYCIGLSPYAHGCNALDEFYFPSRSRFSYCTTMFIDDSSTNELPATGARKHCVQIHNVFRMRQLLAFDLQVKVAEQARFDEFLNILLSVMKCLHLPLANPAFDTCLSFRALPSKHVTLRFCRANSKYVLLCPVEAVDELGSSVVANCKNHLEAV